MAIKLTDLNIHDIGNTVQITGVVYSGVTNNRGRTHYLCFFPGEGDDPFPLEPLEMDSADWEIFLRQTDLLETEILKSGKDGVVTKAIVRKTQRMIDTNVQWKVFKRDGYKCRYCNVDNMPLTVDHLVLWEEGGPSIEKNLVAACKKCNRTRGNKQYSEWLDSDDYLSRSFKLTPEQFSANRALLSTLSSIPKLTHMRSR